MIYKKKIGASILGFIYSIVICIAPIVGDPMIAAVLVILIPVALVPIYLQIGLDDDDFTPEDKLGYLEDMITEASKIFGISNEPVYCDQCGTKLEDGTIIEEGCCVCPYCYNPMAVV